MGVFKMFKKLFGKKPKGIVAYKRPAKFVRVNGTFWAVPDLVPNLFGGYTPVWPKDMPKMWIGEPSKHQLNILEDLMGFHSDNQNEYTFNA
jgi:hypothetical protein